MDYLEFLRKFPELANNTDALLEIVHDPDAIRLGEVSVKRNFPQIDCPGVGQKSALFLMIHSFSWSGTLFVFPTVV